MNAVEVLLNIDVPEGSNARVLVESDVGGRGWSLMAGGWGVTWISLTQLFQEPRIIRPHKHVCMRYKVFFHKQYKVNGGQRFIQGQRIILYILIIIM